MLVTRSWLSAVVTSIITASFALPARGQPSSAAPDKAAAQLAEIVGRVETLNVPVVGITFQIEYHHVVNGRVADVGSDWPTFLRNAQALIDRRFPPVKHDAPATQPEGDHHHDDPGKMPDEKKPKLDGSWKSTLPDDNHTHSTVLTMNIKGNTYEFTMSFIAKYDGQKHGNTDRGTISGPDGGPYTLTSQAGTGVITLSADGQTFVSSGGGVNQTFRRVK
jgi:hypothetical protein